MDVINTGKIIRTLRVEKGLTQKQLAEVLNVSDKTVSKWECGGELLISSSHEMTKEHYIICCIPE